MYTLMIMVEVLSGWFSGKWGKGNAKRRKNGQIEKKTGLRSCVFNGCKKKKILLEKQDKDGKDSKAELGFAFCQGFTHLALASILAFPSK